MENLPEILIIDDDVGLASNLRDSLAAEGCGCVEGCVDPADLDEAIKIVRKRASA